MSRLLATLLVLALSCFLPAQGPLFQILDDPIPFAPTPPDAIGDIDGDGDADLISANGVFLNDGHGRFTAVPNPPLTFQRFHTTLADLNNDGMLDVVSLDSAGLVRIDLNLGGLSFVGPVGGLPVVSGYAQNFAAGDVDLDGDVDILVGVNTGASSIAVLWLNNGSGTFAPATFPSIQLPLDRIFLADLDADGDLDALFGAVQPSTGSIAILLNLGGTFTPSGPFFSTASPWTLELGHFNSDAFPDLVVSAGLLNPALGTTVFFGSAAGFLAPVTTSILASVLIATDLNGDGSDELVGQSSSTSPIWVRSVGPSGTVGPVTQSWPGLILMQSPAPRDLDGDGDRDLIASSASGPVELMNAGNGNLVIVGGRTAGLTIARGQRRCDLDGDGDADIVGLQSPGLVTTGRNDGNGWFAGPAVPIIVPATFVSYSSEPFDGDGDGDSDLYLAAFNLTTPPPFDDLVFANTGGVFTQVATVTGTGLTARVKAADIDADGDQDIVLGRWGGPMLMVPNLGGTGFGAPISFGSASHVTSEFEVEDFDGNGLLDVFQLTPYSAPPDWSIVWLNSGAGFTQVVQTGINGSYVAAGDLNADGFPDLVIDGQVWFSTGAGGLVPGPVLYSPLAGPIVLADVDLDGDLDIVETPATVFFHAGGGNFGAPVSYLPRPTFAAGGLPIPRSVVADVDHDGDIDIVAPGPIVLVNTTRQIARGSIARPGRPASIDLYGTPGGAWFLWASNGTTSFPFPPWGTVLIDPTSAQLGAMGAFTGPTAPLPGTSTLSVLVPNNPALLGWTTYWQSVDAAQMRLTNRIPITVLGY